MCGTFDTSRSTSGGFVELIGASSFLPLDWFSKRQSATSHSTTEAELVAASKMLRESLVPLQSLWDLMLQRPVKAVLHEDNMSTIVVINAGYSPQLRHIQKHHRISLGEVSELMSHKSRECVHIETEKQKGDLMTKGLARPKHEPAMKMVGLYPIIIFPG